MSEYCCHSNLIIFITVNIMDSVYFHKICILKKEMVSGYCGHSSLIIQKTDG